MLRSAQETSSKEKLSRGKPSRAMGKQQQQQNRVEQEDNSKGDFGIQWISTLERGTHEEELMNFSK
jgi:hypothetical protein